MSLELFAIAFVGLAAGLWLVSQITEALRPVPQTPRVWLDDHFVPLSPLIGGQDRKRAGVELVAELPQEFLTFCDLEAGMADGGVLSVTDQLPPAGYHRLTPTRRTSDANDCVLDHGLPRRLAGSGRPAPSP